MERNRCGVRDGRVVTCGRRVHPAWWLSLAIASAMSAPVYAQSFNWTGNQSLNWNHPQNWDPQQVPGVQVPGANAYVMSANDTVQVTNHLTLGHLETMVPVRFWSIIVTAGSADTTDLINQTSDFYVGALNLNGVTQWNGGILGGGSTANNNGTLLINTTMNLRKPLTNLGLVSQVGTTYLGVGGDIINQSTWDIGSTNLGLLLDGASNGMFLNNGLLRSNATGTFTLGVPFDSGAGSVQINAGEFVVKRDGTYDGTWSLANNAVLKFLTMQDETANFHANATFHGQGDVRVNGTKWWVHDGAIVTAAMDASSPTGFQIDSAYTTILDGTLLNMGKMRWSSGSLDGMGGLENRATLTVSGASQLRTTIANTDGGTAQQLTSITFVNGLLDLQQGSEWELAAGHISSAGGTNQVIIDGLLRRTGGQVVFANISVPILMLDGQIQLESNGMLGLNAGGEFAGDGGIAFITPTVVQLNNAVFEVSGMPTIVGTPDATFRLAGNAGLHTTGGTMTVALESDDTTRGFQLLGSITSDGPGNGAVINKESMNAIGALIGTALNPDGELINDGRLVISSTMTAFGRLMNGVDGEVAQNGQVSLIDGEIVNEGEWRSNDVHINGIGTPGGSVFHNTASGVFIKEYTLESRLDGTTLLNNEGTVIARSGILRLYNVAQVQGDTLTGGRWQAEGSGQIIFEGTNIRVLGPTAHLRYDGGSFGNLLPTTLQPQSSISIPHGTLNLPYLENGGQVILEGPGQIECDEEIDNGILGEIDEKLVLAFQGTEEPMLIATAMNNAGTLRPGGADATGPFNFTGTLRQQASGTLDVELGGAVPVTQHDQFRITGDVELDGTLRLSLLDGFEPEAGATFTVLTATGNISGAFSAVDTTGLGDLLVTVQYLPQSVVVKIGYPGELASYSMLIGQYLSGTLDDLRATDDQVMRLRSTFGFSVFEPNIFEIRLLAQTAAPPTSLMDIAVTSRVNNPNGTVKVRLRRWSNGSVTQVAQFPVGMTETTGIAENIDGSPYIDASGQIDLRLRYTMLATFSVIGFDAWIDSVIIRIE